ncbi:MAG: Gfo/Idh/MocA family oxidoreductase, partial [Planctomycetes bacterium]|nr:Gfo/Idh/MocA family oxidoreductase [Planctomycetota bacterium]
MSKIGIIGMGSRAHAHAKAIAEADGMELAGIAEIDEKKRKEAAEKYDTKTYEDYNDLIASGLDAVIIVTPGFVHREPAIAAAEAGIHILCEKPIALKLEDADAMIDAVEEAGVKMLVGFVPPYDAQWATLRKVFQSGKIGDLVYCWTRRLGNFPLKGWDERRRQGHWRMSQELSGGRVMEMSSHDVGWLCQIGGDVVEVHSKLAIFSPGVETDELNVNMLTFEKAFGTLVMCKAPTGINENSIGIMGTKGSIAVRQGKIIHRMMDEPEEELPVEPCDSLHEHFFKCLTTDEQPLTDGWTGRQA